MTASREDNARWLAAAAAVGVPVQRVELANEPYFGQVEGTNNTSVLFPTAESHVAFVKPLAVTLRRQSPAAQLAYPAFVPRVDVATGGISAGHDERMLTWTQRALNADIARDIDAFALHFYPRLPGRRGQSDAAYLTELSSFPEAYWRATLGTPQWKLLPTDKRLWITELNASFADAPELVGTWMHGLLQAQLAVLALQDPRMDLVLQHMLTGNPQWQAVVHPGRTPDIVPAPGYQRYALTATGESLAAVSAVVSGARCVSAIPTGQAGAVAIAAESSVRRSVVVVNAAAVSVQLDIRSVGWMTATASVVTAEPLSKIAAGGAIRRTAVVPQSPAYLYRIPPWSVTTLVRVD
ncbi:hypothetical protein [Gemmatimonas sp.]|uniref:hypothetical protein n=1 Tax=Gemmatimonas sp. TaxID=1962908 RepID=UPI00333FFBFE